MKTIRKKDAEPTISDMVCFEDTKGTIVEVFKRPELTHQKFQTKGIVPHKLGHVAFHVADVKKATQFYCDVLGFRVSDWMGDFFSFLRCGPDHHTINLVETGSNRHSHRVRAARLVASADGLRSSQYERIQIAVGPWPTWDWAQSVYLSPQPVGPHY